MMLLATVFLAVFGALAAFDGLYFHLWKYRLYARAESLYEHKLHTARAFLFVPIVFLLFYGEFAGAALWAALFLIAVDLVIEIVDVLDENDSRRGIGGLSSIEYATHVLATTARVAAMVLALAAKPAAAWSLAAPFSIGPGDAATNFVALNVVAANFVVGALHLWLMRPQFRASGLLPVRTCCGV